MPFRRSVLLINKRFQLRFAIYVCSWVIALSFVYPLIVHSLFEYFIRYAALDPLGPPLAGIQKTRQEVISLLVVFQLIFLGISLVISIFISHRIAGPLYKLTKSMESLRKGKLQDRLAFRTKDYFQDLAESYNQMVSGLKSIIDRNTDSLSSAISKLEDIQRTSSDDQRAKIESVLATLRETREKMPQ